MALFFFLLLLISHREQLLLVQGHQMRDLPRLREIGQAGSYPRLTSLSIKNPYPEESRSSRMRGEKGPYSVPHSVLLSALPGNIYLHKLDQEIGRIRQKYEIPIVQRIRSVLLRTGRIDDQENSGEEASFNAPQDNRAIIVGRVKSIQRKAAFHSLVSSWHTPPTSTPRLRGDQFVFPPSLALAAFLNKPSSLLCAAFLIEAAGLTPKAEFYGREGFNNNWAMRDFIKYCKRKGLLIELGGEAILVIRSERRLARKLAPFKTHYNIRICYARYADDSLLGIVGAVELLIEIQKRIAHFLQSGLNLWVSSAGSTTITARSTVEFLGTIIREVPPRTTPIQFLRELEKRLRLRSEQGAIGRSTGSLTIGHECPEVVIVYSHGSEGGGERRGTLGEIYQHRIPHTNRGAYQKDTLKASGSRCRDNLYQVRTIVDHQIRWSAIFTPAHKHKSSARNIIPKYSKDSNIINKEGGKTLAEFPNSIELGKLGPGQDPNNKEHSTISLV
ncbi:hypothetical protein RHMOL_Rhmol02G0241800 [Rhododendron molle]|uniref:Uncharacterized protein n=1 Tax=Rhododendron molle TaxID=49168 RepID=A0ACC0PWB7_RHOML|nr:hypothetical protein RHMOL_Rhmol02G0241800 [Rhododendron molle]